MSQERGIIPSNKYQFPETNTGWFWGLISPIVSIINIVFRSASFTHSDGINLLENSVSVGTNILSLADNNQKETAKKISKSVAAFTSLLGFSLNPKIAAFARGFTKVHDLAFGAMIKLIRPKSPWSFEFVAGLEILKNTTLPQFLKILEKELWQFDNFTNVKKLKDEITKITAKISEAENDVTSLVTKIFNIQNEIAALQASIKNLQTQQDLLRPQIKNLTAIIKDLKAQLRNLIPKNKLSDIEYRLEEGWKLYTIDHPTWDQKMHVKHHPVDSRYSTKEGIMELLSLGYKVRLKYKGTKVEKYLFPDVYNMSIKYFFPQIAEQSAELANKLTTLQNLSDEYKGNDSKILAGEAALRENRSALSTAQAFLVDKTKYIAEAKKHLAFLKNKLEAFALKEQVKNISNSIINYAWKEMEWSDLIQAGLDIVSVIEFLRHINKTNYFSHIKNSAKTIVLLTGTATAIIKTLDRLYHSRGQAPHQNALTGPTLFTPIREPTDNPNRLVTPELIDGSDQSQISTMQNIMERPISPDNNNNVQNRRDSAAVDGVNLPVFISSSLFNPRTGAEGLNPSRESTDNPNRLAAPELTDESNQPQISTMQNIMERPISPDNNNNVQNRRASTAVDEVNLPALISSSLFNPRTGARERFTINQNSQANNYAALTFTERAAIENLKNHIQIHYNIACASRPLPSQPNQTKFHLDNIIKQLNFILSGQTNINRGLNEVMNLAKFINTKNNTIISHIHHCEDIIIQQQSTPSYSTMS